MAIYEQLLSKDPIGAFEKIREDYCHYFKTMYRFREDALDKKKNDKLVLDDNLSKEPYCELMPKYESMGKDLKDLCCPSGDYDSFSSKIRPLPNSFADFINAGLMDYKPYRHQFEMLCKGYGLGNDVLITSGTGSGKTESFMLPLLASLLDEAQKWTAPVAPYDPSWWKVVDPSTGKYKPSQRQNETRPSAIRSLLLYPMNALVADQVGRLRKALDSDKVRKYLDCHCNQNRIFFGSYNGETLKAEREDTVDKLSNLKTQSDLLESSVSSGKCDPDDIYVTPRLSDTDFTCEMLIREDMQEKCPDIMITNISMLSIMLMRTGEQDMLDQTRKYYEENPEAKFHLVVDELHLHRGTSGSEVAYLLRMFLDRIGVPPMKNGKKNPQLQVYASSASLGSANTYLEEFFGIINPFEIQQGYNLTPVVKSGLPALNYEYFDTFYNDNRYLKPYYELTPAEKDVLEKSFLTKLGYIGTFQQFIDDYASVIYNDLNGLITSNISTFPLTDLSKLNGSPSDDAIRGFLIFRGNVEHSNLPSIRFHQFYRYIDGLWGELLPDKDPSSPVGEVLYHPTEVSTSGQHKVLELLRCECCGELFIGGNRTDCDNGVLLTLNSPRLDAIPNFQATPMVQKKNIREYALFWPSKKKPVQGWYSSNPSSNTYDRFGVVNVIGKHTLRTEGNDDCHGAWRHGYLNPCDGKVIYNMPPSMLRYADSYIEGYVYCPRDKSTSSPVDEYGAKVLKALPCKCPACEKDYLRRKYTQSPIRSFRTGMGRNNQLLSKELLYQLEPSGQHGPKLIGFSDSRQDAAEQSKLIAREHYRDMLRLIFINILAKKSLGGLTPSLSTLISVLEAYLPIHTPTYLSHMIDYALGVETSDKDALKAIVASGKPQPQIIADLRSYSPAIGVVDLNNLISKTSNQIDGELIAELLRLGINPSGTEYSDMYPTKGKEYWDTYYDFTPGFEKMNAAAYTKQSNIYGKILGESVYSNIESNIFSNCFGQYMNVNTEVAGLGYVTSKDISGDSYVADLANLLAPYLSANGLTIEGVISALIRIYGDNYRYNGDFEADAMPNFSSFIRPLKLAVACLSGKAAVDEQELGEKISSAMVSVATDSDGKLCLEKPLRFILTHKGDVYYKCKSCGRIHLHRGLGICTNTSCFEELPLAPDGKVEDLWENNYISFDVKKEPHTPKRLHSEELTGQTDDQISRLLCFKDIMLGDSQLLSRAIDMLCVTTTMEVGVDIGSLQAVYQGNMPPTRYNYQQRVGRAGRRNQAFSVALTFCRGRSHDIYYYYQATDRITGGKPADPTISVNPVVGGVANPVVLKRIVLKHILMLFSAKKPSWAVAGGTIAQLGVKDDWDGIVKPALEAWIAKEASKIDDVILYYTQQFVAASDPLNVELSNWIKNDVVNQMDEAIKASTHNDSALAIAEAGLLPMYGMPASIRCLYHDGYANTINHKYHEYFTGKIDRPIEQSISEFAPGAIKTKDAAEYQSAGLTIPLEKVNSYKCTSVPKLDAMKDELDPLQHSYNLNMNGEEIVGIEPYNPRLINPSSYDVIRLVVPKAYRTDKIFDNKGDSCQEDDSRSNYSSVSVWVDAKTSKKEQFSGGAAMWEVWNGDNKKGDVWYVNTNNSMFFRGQRAMKAGPDYTYEPRFYKKKLDALSRPGVLERAPSFMFEGYFKDKAKGGPWETHEVPETIAIGTRKITDILCLSFDPAKIPSTINLNATSGNKSAIVAAMYSAATLIQRVFADEIDIQPEELEISEVKINPLNGLPSVYLNDSAANGAGYVSLLSKVNPLTNKTKLQEIMEDIASATPRSDFMRSVLAHKNSCATACPKCLNTFYNRGLHHVLDWRLGVDIIKLMIDQTYDMGYTDLSNTPYGDLAELLNEIGERTELANPAGNVKYHHNDLHDWKTGYFETKVIGGTIALEHLVHPLWNVGSQESTDGYIAQNSFVLQRTVKPLPKKCAQKPAAVASPSATTSSKLPPQTPTTPVVGSGGYGSLG